MTENVKWYGDDILKEIKSATPDGLFAAGQMLIDAASSRVPVASGDLKNSGYVATEEKSTYRHSKKHRKETKAPKGGAVAGFAVFYAKFVEYGTSKQSAKPYLRPAFDELKGQMGDKISVTIGKKLPSGRRKR